MKKHISHISPKRRKPLISRIPLIAVVSLISLIFFLHFASGAKAAPWWTGGGGSWKARKLVTVTNNSSSNLSSGTTVAISVDTQSLVNAGKLKSNCADLRILYQPDSSTTTEVTRHIVYSSNTSGIETCATSKATKVYFKLQAALNSSASSTSYYLYYQNSGASTPSSTDAAFNLTGITATLVCPFNGSTTCAAGETPSTESGAVRYSGSKSALSFDAMSDNVSAGTSTTLQLTSDGTVEAWIKIPRVITYGFFISKGSSSDATSNNYAILQNDVSGNLRFYLGNGTSGVAWNGSASVADGNWHHVAISWTAGSAKSFVDGTQDGSTQVLGFTPGGFAGNQLYLGRDATNNYPGVSILDDVRISNIARYTGTFTTSTKPFVRDSNTALLLHFDENGDDPRNTGKAIDDSGNGNHGTITGAKYVAGLTGVDNGTSDTGNLSGQSYAGHEGVLVEEGTTNKITNPSFENGTFDTNWTTNSNLTSTVNTTAPYYKFGANSAKLVASAGALSGTTNMFTTSINVGSTATHMLSAYVYDGTTGNVGGTITSSIAKLVYNGTAQTTTYTDMGGGWWRLTYTAAGINSAANYGVEAQVSKTVYVDGVQLEALGYATTYTDGTLGTGYAWTGTANNSTSTRTIAATNYATSGNVSGTAGTISLWYKVETSNQTHFGSLFDMSSSGGNLFMMRTRPDFANGFVQIFFGPSFLYVQGGAGAHGSWEHVVITYTNGGNMTLYVNGSSVGTPVGYTTTTLGSTLYVGSPSSFRVGNEYSVDTPISDFRIYDTALSSTQVTDLYQAGLVGHSEGNQTDYFSTNKGQNPVAVWHMDEGYGSTTYDSSIYTNNLTLGTGSSAPTWTVNTTGNGNPRNVNLKFDGSNDYITRTYDADFDVGTSDFSIGGWFRHPSTISGTDTILARYGTAGYKVYMNSSGFVCFAIDDDSTWTPDDSACSTTSYADSKWHNFEAVKTGTTSIVLYIDGVSVATDSSIAATGTLNTSSSLYFGIDSDVTSNPWDGYLDEFAFYPYAKTAAQVKNDYQAIMSSAVLGANTSDPLTNGLVGYWKMDESSGNATDSSGNAYTLNNNNTTTFTSGKFGSASSYNGSSKYFSTASTISSVQTVAFWVYPSSTTDNFINLNGSTYITSSSGTVSATGSTSPSIYVNGVLNGTTTASTWNHVVVTTGTAISASTFEVGRANSSYLSNTSKMDEVRLYNRALSPGEVQQLYNFAPGPVGYWKLDEKTGTSANDSSGNTYTGTLGTGNSAPSWTTGKYGAGLSFDGTNDYVSVGSTAPGVQTVSFWTNPATTTQSLVGLNGSAYVSASSGTISATGFTSPTIYVNGVVSSTLAANTWQYITITTATSISAGAINFGKANSSFLNGKLDDIKFYNYVRSSKQIVEDMNAGHPAGGSLVGSQVGYWKFDEGFGTTANNVGIGGTALNGTLGTGSSAPSWTNSGKFGKALSFDGTNDYVNTGTSLDMSSWNQLTVSAWFKVSDTNNRTIVSKYCAHDNGFASSVFKLYANSSNVYFRMTTQYGNWGQDVSTPISTGVWYHVAGVWDGVNQYVYLNGVKSTDVKSEPGTIYNASSRILIGTEERDCAGAMISQYSGQIDEVKIYSAALSPDEIKIDYNQGKSLVLGALSDNSSYQKQAANQEYCVPGDSSSCSAPVLEWKLDEKTGTSANDTSGNANTGTFGASTAAPTWTTGKIGSAVNFDGVNDTVSKSSYSLSAPFTLEMWFNPTQWTHAARFGGFASGDNGIMTVVSAGNKLQFSNCASSALSSIGLNSWNHIAIVNDGTNTSLYYNNAFVGSCLSSIVNAISNVYLGTNSDGLTTGWPFKVDNFWLFNYARSAAQVAWDYNRGGPVGWWKMDECSGSTINDATGNGYTGTLTVGASGTQTSVGTCNSGTSTEAWNNGSSGKFNASLNFDGTDDYISVGTSVPMNSVSFWVKPTSSTASMINLTGSAYITASSGTISATGFTSPTYYINGVATTSPTLTANAWNHIVVTTGTSITANTFTIGKANSAFTAGQIDDVRIYNYALTATQIKNVMNEGAAVRYGPASGAP